MTSTETSNSGIHVVEGLARGQAISVDGDSVTAFIAPTPRGPVDRAVEVSSLEEFQRIFDLPGSACRLAGVIRDFFANGGSNAVVVRVSGSDQRARMRLPGPAGDMVLEARNPGASEYLRAAVDYDGIDTTSYSMFNLVLQRLREPDSAWIESQECFRRISIEPTSRDYVGYVLNQSDLAVLVNEAPSARPLPTYEPGSLKQPNYIAGESISFDQPGPTDYDLIGSEHRGTGLNALEHVSDVGMVCLLTESDPGAGPIALLAADSFCRRHQALLLIDPPARWRTVADVMNDQSRAAFSSPNALTWFPNLLIRDDHNDEHQFASAVGAIAAALVAAHRSGVNKLGADPVLLRGSGTRLGSNPNASEAARLKRAGINILRQISPLHLELDGNVTLARNDSLASDWQDLDVRYRVLSILRRIRNATQWTFFHESSPQIWQELTEQISGYLTELHARSILSGQYSSQAFYIKCDRDTNRGLIGKTGEVTFIVGFALRRPGEFLAFRLQRSHGGCRIVELGWDSGLQRAS